MIQRFSDHKSNTLENDQKSVIGKGKKSSKLFSHGIWLRIQLKIQIPVLQGQKGSCSNELLVELIQSRPPARFFDFRESVTTWRPILNFNTSKIHVAGRSGRPKIYNLSTNSNLKVPFLPIVFLFFHLFLLCHKVIVFVAKEICALIYFCFLLIEFVSRLVTWYPIVPMIVSYFPPNVFSLLFLCMVCHNLCDWLRFVFNFISPFSFFLSNRCFFCFCFQFIYQKWDKHISLLNIPRVMISPLTHTPVPTVVVLLNPVLLARIAKTEW